MPLAEHHIRMGTRLGEDISVWMAALQYSGFQIGSRLIQRKTYPWVEKMLKREKHLLAKPTTQPLSYEMSPAFMLRSCSPSQAWERRGCPYSALESENGHMIILNLVGSKIGLTTYLVGCRHTSGRKFYWWELLHRDRDWCWWTRILTLLVKLFLCWRLKRIWVLCKCRTTQRRRLRGRVYLKRWTISPTSESGFESSLPIQWSADCLNGLRDCHTTGTAAAWRTSSDAI